MNSLQLSVINISVSFRVFSGYFLSLITKICVICGQKWRRLGLRWRRFGTLWRHSGQTWRHLDALWYPPKTKNRIFTSKKLIYIKFS